MAQNTSNMNRKSPQAFPLHPASIPAAMRPLSLAARRVQELKDAQKRRKVLTAQMKLTPQQRIIFDKTTPSGMTRGR
jgi:hypothetical protein